MSKTEYIDLQEEQKKEQVKNNNNYDNKINIFLKLINKTHNLLEFILALFTIYIIVTIEWSWIKIIMLIFLVFYVITTFLLIYIMTKIEINRRFK